MADTDFIFETLSTAHAPAPQPVLPALNRCALLFDIDGTLLDLAPTPDAVVVPKGLRIGNITSDFVIKDVPDGKYVVLAAFENDGLVRDPDVAIGGTQIAHITVAGQAQAISTSFKVTGSLAVVSPGADKLDEVGKNVDAVTVSTPDHMHAAASAMAMRLGKACFTQKPLTRTIAISVA